MQFVANYFKNFKEFFGTFNNSLIQRSQTHDDVISEPQITDIPKQEHLNPHEHRANFINKICDKNFEKILEIGPFTNPLINTEKVKYFDVLNKSKLTQRAKSLNLDTSRIPEIDFVSRSGNLKSIKEKFDCIFSSHCIEHQPDLIKHLRCISNLLYEQGSYFLIIPDKRYCFDHFMPESNIAKIIQAHFDKRTKHTLCSVIEHRALITHNDPIMHWDGNHGDQFSSIKVISSAITEYLNSASYIDVHAWHFTPESFVAIIEILNELSYIDLTVEQFYETPRGGLEFFVVLRKSVGKEILPTLF